MPTDAELLAAARVIWEAKDARRAGESALDAVRARRDQLASHLDKLRADEIAAIKRLGDLLDGRDPDADPAVVSPS